MKHTTVQNKRFSAFRNINHSNKHFTFICLLLSFFTFCISAIAGNSPKQLDTLKISEPLGFSWEDELIKHEIHFKKGQVLRPFIVAVDSASKQSSTLPSQVTDVSRYSDGTISSLTVWLMLSIAPNEERTINFYMAEDEDRTSGVEIKEEENTLLLSTTTPQKIGIRIPRGEKTYDIPKAASEIPAPIQGFLLPSGAVTSPGVLDIPFDVLSWKSEVVNHGPLFTDVQITYNFNVGYWNCNLRVIKNSGMIVLDEELNTGRTDIDAKVFNRFHRIPLSGRKFAPQNIFFGGRNRDEIFSNVVKDGYDKELLERANLRFNWFSCAEQGYSLDKSPQGLHYVLNGYPAHQNRMGMILRAVSKNGDAIGFAGLSTEKWRNPLTIRFSKGEDGTLSALFPLQRYPQDWIIDGFGDESPNYTGIVIGAPDAFVKRSIGIMISEEKGEEKTKLQTLFTQARKHSVFAYDSIRRWNYEWNYPDTSKATAETVGPEAQKALDFFTTRIELYRRYGVMAVYSMALHFDFAKNHYKFLKEAADKPEAFTPEAYARFQRFLTFNAAYMNSESSFPYGMGFHLNNPNMTVMDSEARFLSSLLVREHPEYENWGKQTVYLLQKFFERFSRPSGAAYENPHYILGATLGFVAPINEMMMANGLDDVFDTERFRKMIRFSLDWVGPPDPRFFGVRTVLPLGNTSYQSIPKDMSEPLIRYFKDSYPDLAGKLQWTANQTYPEDKKTTIVEDIVPDLKSVFYEGDGVSFRHGFGTPYETLLRFRAGDCDGHYEWESDQMSYTLYAKGQPINLTFANGYFPMFCRPWLRNRVSFDMKFELSERNETKVMAVAFSPEADYLCARRDVDQLGTLTEYPSLDEKRKWNKEENDGWVAMRANPEDIPLVSWYRQIMFLKDADPKGPNYFVIADNFGGTPTVPTDINFWFLANSMTQSGNLFHYDGQLDADMDVFVHTPQKFKPHFDSYGHQEQLYGALFTWDKTKHPDGKKWEEQKLLRIRQNPGQSYLTVLYPRLKNNDPAASYKRLADNVVEVETELSRDVIMMRAFKFNYVHKDFTFTGKSGAVRYYKDGKTVILNNEDSADFVVEGQKITGTGPYMVVLHKGKTAATPLATDATVKVEAIDK